MNISILSPLVPTTQCSDLEFYRFTQVWSVYTLRSISPFFGLSETGLIWNDKDMLYLLNLGLFQASSPILCT